MRVSNKVLGKTVGLPRIDKSVVKRSLEVPGAGPNGRSRLEESAVVRSCVLVVAAAAVTLACERSPAGVLQETVVVTSRPPTEAFAERSILSPSATPSSTGSGLGATRDNNVHSATAPGSAAANSAAPMANDVPDERACSVVGFVNAKKVSEDHYDLNRSAVAAIADALQQRPNTAASRQLVPVRSERGMPGLRVEGVGERAGCGLRSGDILVAINGISVTNEDELARNRQKLVSAQELKLVIERDRDAKVLTYDVGD